METSMPNDTEHSGISIVPSGAALGADVVGYNMSERLTDAQLKVIEAAWAEHLVLRFRGNHNLSHQNLIDFSGALGVLDHRPVRGSVRGGFNDLPLEINVISNIVVDGRPIGGLGYGEADWHSDMTYKEV